jgi:hypothetical protein
MKLLKKVDRLEIKRCFVMTHFIRKFGVAKKNSPDIPSQQKYLVALEKSKKSINKLSEKQLDRIIGKYKKRLRAYNKMQWYVGEVSTKDVGAWRGAGGLPISWTHDSLFHTAQKVRKALKDGDKKIKLKNVIKKDEYLFPVMFEGDTGTRGRRKSVAKQKWDLDDGNMRAIAFAVSGDKKLKGYVGVTVLK